MKKGAADLVHSAWRSEMGTQLCFSTKAAMSCPAAGSFVQGRSNSAEDPELRVAEELHMSLQCNTA